MTKKIAIIGTASSTLDQAPWLDYSWTIYTLARHSQKMDRSDLAFEIHDTAGVHGGYYSDAYVKTCHKMPLVCLSGMARRLKGKPFPVRAAMALRSGRWYLQGSATYMLAYAILQGAEEIGIWGVDMANDSEYSMQRPCLESWIGFAEGRGIKVTIPENSALMSVPWRYGIDAPERRLGTPNRADALQRQIAGRIDKLKASYKPSDLVAYIGGIHVEHIEAVSRDDFESLSIASRIAAYEDALEMVRVIERGADVKTIIEKV